MQHLRKVKSSYFCLFSPSFQNTFEELLTQNSSLAPQILKSFPYYLNLSIILKNRVNYSLDTILVAYTTQFLL